MNSNSYGPWHCLQTSISHRTSSFMSLLGNQVDLVQVAFQNLVPQFFTATLQLPEEKA
jgi:hypothetical protein